MDVILPGEESPPVGERSALEVDWDAPGTLSIVMQGGLSEGNLVETANHAAHWRSLFPGAEIILAISVTDVVVATADAEHIRLAGRHRHNGLLQVAVRLLRATCDKIAISRGALPFPPLKLDGHGANNVNLQIAAAQTGLAAATGRYVLRVRSDLVFLSRQFLDQYAHGCGFERGSSSVFRDRVLVSWLYTLNPYTIERMPFHVSDWFHFGLTEDIRRIWDIPFMTLADALHHKAVPHPAFVNPLEQMIIPRFAIEQYITYQFFKSEIPDLVLDHLVDWRSRDRSVDLLVDNFVICDVRMAECVFDKYGFDFTNSDRHRHCVTREDWLAMAALSGEPRRKVLADKSLAVAHPETRPFPRTWSAGSLSTKQGRRTGEKITAAPHAGVVIHGPYDIIPSGRYLAVLHTTACRGRGDVTLRITLDEGLRVLAERKVRLHASEDQTLDLPFDLLSGIGTDVELVVEVDGKPQIVVTGLTFEERPSDGYRFFARLDARTLPMIRRFGTIGPSGLSTDACEGHLLFGPLMSLAAGSYRARFLFAEIDEPADARVEVTAEVRGSSEQRVLVSQQLGAGEDRRIQDCVFELDVQTSRVEFRVWVTDRSRLTISEIVLDRL